MEAYKAVVQRVIRDGAHGPYAVASSIQLDGSVTFSLEPTVWVEDELPEEGVVVLLSDIRRKRAGWRAKKGRLFRPSDEQGADMYEFLYPYVEKFPFDSVCAKIVRALEERNWRVPGITVEFHTYGTGEQKFRAAGTITGPDFRLWFSRKQRTMPGGVWNDTAAVCRVNIPMKELSVYEDECGPTLYVYVGGNWKRDREAFERGSKFNAKLNREPKTYLKYEGGWRLPEEKGFQYTMGGQRAPYLVHTTDNREYMPNLLEPKYFKTEQVFREFTAFLEKVLVQILTHPVPAEKVDVFTEPDAIPWTMGPLFTFCKWREAGRIKKGKEDKDQLPPTQRYGLQGSGYRLAPLDTSNDGTVPKIAYDGFLWCGIGDITAETDPSTLEIPGHYRWADREQYVVRITPSRANDIYIADHAPFEHRRKELEKEGEKEGRDRFTDAEVHDFTCARARTIIPISEYKGDFEQPVVLVNRELGLDEVEIISGPHEDED